MDFLNQCATCGRRPAPMHAFGMRVSVECHADIVREQQPSIPQPVEVPAGLRRAAEGKGVAKVLS